jgi:dephospho-CoA kinase
MKIGITGGIGSGKSFVCQRLKTRGIEVYDCDSAAKRLIRTSDSIRGQLTQLIGEDAYIGESLNKVAVARFLLASESNAQAIDHIVHPAVFQDFMDSGMQWMESAILYESGINKLVDRVIVVTAPLEIRIQRVMQRDGITRENVEQWMQRQWSQEEVRKRADYEIVNDGITDIDVQIDKLLNKII